MSIRISVALNFGDDRFSLVSLSGSLSVTIDSVQISQKGQTKVGIIFHISKDEGGKWGLPADVSIATKSPSRVGNTCSCRAAIV